MTNLTDVPMPNMIRKVETVQSRGYETPFAIVKWLMWSSDSVSHVDHVSMLHCSVLHFEHGWPFPKWWKTWFTEFWIFAVQMYCSHLKKKKNRIQLLQRKGLLSRRHGFLRGCGNVSCTSSQIMMEQKMKEPEAENRPFNPQLFPRGDIVCSRVPGCNHRIEGFCQARNTSPDTVQNKVVFPQILGKKF